MTSKKPRKPWRSFPKASTLKEAFFLRVKKQPNRGCWDWVGCIDRTGYGRILTWTKGTMAHRLSYELHGGILDPKLTIDHLCRNRKCVNPKHLEQVPMSINFIRGESPMAKSARKTHCVRGHKFTKQNTVFRSKAHPNWRNCRLCEKWRIETGYNKKYQDKYKTQNKRKNAP